MLSVSVTYWHFKLRNTC